MYVKEVSFGEKAGNGLRNGIKTLSDAVGSTLGPRGNTVLIEAEDKIGGKTATKDGVTVSRYVNLKDPIENMAIQVMREAAQGTVNEAGDGTTTSIVLAQAIVQQFDSYNTEDLNVTEVIRYINKFAKEIVAILESKSQEVEGTKLLDVATISANNDEELGNLIAEAYQTVTKRGVVMAEDGRDHITEVEYRQGISFNRGYTSTYQLTNREKDIIELKDPLVLVTDREIESLHDIAENVLRPVAEGGKSILIIGNMSMQAQAALNKNIHANNLKAAFVIPPEFGYRSTFMLEDIAMALGATFISEQTNDNWMTVGFKDLGRAEKVTIDRSSTTIIDSSDAHIERRNKRVEQLEQQIEIEKDKGSREDLQNRVANLCGNIAKITVGGKTPMEQKERRDRVDDAILATKAALDKGILPGGGLALYSIGISPIESAPENKNEYAAEMILKDALVSPIARILSNAGIDYRDIVSSDEFNHDKNIGFDVRNEVYGDMIEIGVIDPTKVTCTAFLNAVSVACTIIGSPVVITNVRDYDKD